MKKSICQRILVLAVFSIGAATLCLAETEKKWGLGVAVGPSMPTGDASFTRFAYGLVSTYRFVPKLDVGLALINRSGIAGAVSNLFGIMAEMNYHFVGDDIGPLYFGIRTGLVSETTTVGSFGFYYAIGEQIGYDFSLGKGLTLGPRATINYAFGTTTSTWVELLGQLKYWF